MTLNPSDITQEHIDEAWRTSKLTGRELCAAMRSSGGGFVPTEDDTQQALARVAEILNNKATQQ